MKPDMNLLNNDAAGVCTLSTLCDSFHCDRRKEYKGKKRYYYHRKNGNTSHLSNEVVRNETKKLSLSFTLILEDTKFCEDFSFQCMGTLRLS